VTRRSCASSNCVQTASRTRHGNARIGRGRHRRRGTKPGSAHATVWVAHGFSLNVEVSGSGPAIVLLHGFTGSASGWGVFGERLRERLTTVAVDIAGHGQSDKPLGTEHYRMPRVVADIVTAVRMAGFERCAWLGYSMGGRTALQVAAAFPGAVERLMLIGASGRHRTDTRKAGLRVLPTTSGWRSASLMRA